MRQFRTLLGYEIKKIFCRKSTWITFAVLLSAYLFSLIMTWSMTYKSVSKEQDDSGKVVSEEWKESYAQKKAREKENGLYWSGRKIDNALLADAAKEYREVMEKTDMDMVEGIGRHEYFSKEMDRFRVLENVLESLTGETGDLLAQAYDSQDRTELTAEKIYEARDVQVKKRQEAYGLTKKECSYWQQKEELLSKPFTYQYSEGFYQLISMNGVYMIVLFSGFQLAVVVSRIFAEEHQRGLDQLILCSRFGRGRLYFAKIAAGILFALLAVAVMSGIHMLVNFAIFGMDGFSAAIQLIAGWYAYPLSVGRILFIMLGICFLASVLTSIFIMVISEKFRSSMAGMAAAIAIIGAARLITVPREFRILSQIWNYFPINLLKLDQGFLDVRLVSVFGGKMTSWQFAPILYLFLGILLVLMGKRCYCRCQVQGR